MPTAESTLVPQFSVNVDGANLPEGTMRDVLECVVESSLHLPDLCTLRVYDYDFKWIDASTFKEGKALEIKAGYGNDPLKTIFDGEIVGLEMDLSAHHTATLIVRAYDKSHRLHRGRKCRTFVDVKDSDIASLLAGESGLSPSVSATKTVRKWILQNNQTDWEFLTYLAKRNGFDLFMKAGKLNFATAGERQAFNSITLEWGKELRSFRPRTSASPQVDTVEVRGWDPQKKQPIVGTANAPKGAPKIGGENDGGKVAKTAFGAAKKTVVVDQPVHSQEEAELLAQSIREGIGQDFLTAEGLCDGTPDLMAGSKVEIKNIGTRFSGTYHITSATHSYSPAEGYTTQFSVSGTQPDNLLSLMGGGGGGMAAGGTTSDIGGNITVGIVTNNKDPEGLGRVQVQYPWMGDQLNSFWARIVSQMAGSGRGFFNLPEVNDEVLIAFEHGDPTRPYVLGQLWNGKDKPPVLPEGSGGGAMSSGPSKPAKDAEISGEGKVDRRGYVSRIGHRLDFSDKDDKGYVWLQTKSGNEIALSDAEEGIWIKTPAGHWIMASDKHQGVKVHSKSGHEVFLDDGGSKVVVKDSAGDIVTLDASGGKITIKANTEINLTAPKINIKADAQLNAESPQTSVKGTATLGLEGATQATLKSGVQVAVQGGAAVDIKGAMVMINYYDLQPPLSPLGERGRG